MSSSAINETDPEIAKWIQEESHRQASKIRLIASENYVSQAVLDATGSCLTNKYSEGYPGRRYYEGQQCIDPIENAAIDRAKSLFGCEHANVQPYSGSPANLEVYNALMEPGDTFMGLALPDGGHLTHGWKVSATGKYYNAVHYGVNPETGRIDMDQVAKLAKEHKPKLIVAGGTAIPRTIDFDLFAEIAKDVGAYFMADIAHIAGLIAGGVHPSPVPVADAVTTTTHKTLRGPRGAMIMCKKSHKKAINSSVFPGFQGGPHNHTTAAIAVALKEAHAPAFKTYAAQIVKNSQALAEQMNSDGFNLITGGTDNHLILADLTPLGVPGKPYAQALDKAGLVLNYNSIPNDPRKPFDPSGIRLGTAAVTSRGFKEPQMKQIGVWMKQTLAHLEDESALAKISAEVSTLCADFPAPGL
jgi:glycine hydroxymethyltransferase